MTEQSNNKLDANLALRCLNCGYKPKPDEDLGRSILLGSPTFAYVERPKCPECGRSLVITTR